MPQYLISYDLKSSDPSPHKPFLDAAEKEDLLYVYKASTLNRLPNTTVWGIFADKDAARAAFDRALSAAGRKLGRAIVLEKRIITRLSDLYVRSDVSKAPVRQWLGTSDLETCRKHQLNDPDFS